MREFIVYLICAILLGLPFQLVFILVIQELRCSIFKNNPTVLTTIVCLMVFFLIAPVVYVMNVAATTTVFVTKEIKYPIAYYIASFFWAATYAAKFPRTDDSYNTVLRRGPTIASAVSFGCYFLLMLKPNLLPELALNCARLLIAGVSGIIPS